MKKPIYDGWQSVLFRLLRSEFYSCATFRRLFVINIDLRNKDIENFCWLCARTRKRSWLEKRWWHRQYSCSDDAQANSRIGLTLSPCMYMCLRGSLSLLSPILLLFSFSNSFSILLRSFFTSSKQLFFHAYDIRRKMVYREIHIN
jgi:hypothetical protein